MTQYSFKELVKKTRMKDHQVRFRVRKLNLGQRVGKRFFLYDDADVRKVRDYKRCS